MYCHMLIQIQYQKIKEQIQVMKKPMEKLIQQGKQQLMARKIQLRMVYKILQEIRIKTVQAIKKAYPKRIY